MSTTMVKSLLIGVLLLVLVGCGKSSDTAASDKAIHQLDKGMGDSWMKFQVVPPAKKTSGPAQPLAMTTGQTPTPAAAHSKTKAAKSGTVGDSWMSFTPIPKDWGKGKPGAVASQNPQKH